MKQNNKTIYMTELAFLIAIEIIMKLTGLSSIPVGPLVMTFNMIPIAIGAILMGPLAGGVLGAVYGFTSFYDAITGASVMTGIFFQLSPIHTFVLCVLTRTLVGVLTGWVFLGLKKIDKTHTISYFVAGLCAPLFNTALFMGYIVAVFYQIDFIQEKVAALGALNPFMYVILSVGMQGLVEAITGLIIGGGVAKGVDAAMHLTNKTKSK